jgi:hypothetical protein
MLMEKWLQTLAKNVDGKMVTTLPKKRLPINGSFPFNEGIIALSFD